MRLPFFVLVPAAVALVAGCSIVNAPDDPIANDGGGGSNMGGGGSGPGLMTASDEASTDEETAIEIDVLANDAGDGLTITAVDGGGVMGAVSQAGGMVQYDPAGSLDQLAEGETISEVISYDVMDAGGETASETLTITVQGINDPPVADDQMVMLNSPTALQLTASDVDTAMLNFVVTQPPMGGQLDNFTVIDGTTVEVTYIPNGAFTGTDSFMFAVDDGMAMSTGMVTVEVTFPPILLGAGSHTINTDMGTIDGTVYPGFNGTEFITSDFEVQTGAVVAVTGSQPLIVDATGNVLVVGILDVSGQDGSVHSGGCEGAPATGGAGGPGGFAGGNGGGLAPGSGTENGANGQGPGGGGGGIIAGQSNGSSDGGNAGHLAMGAPGANTLGGTVGFGGPPYNSLPPLVGGSGGGGSSVEKDSAAGMLSAGDDSGGAGGGGGGAVRLIAAGTLTVSGSIDASGGNGSQGTCSASGGGGSGGAIELAAPGTGPMVSGLLNVLGGSSSGMTTSASVGRTMLITLP